MYDIPRGSKRHQLSISPTHLRYTSQLGHPIDPYVTHKHCSHFAATSTAGAVGKDNQTVPARLASSCLVLALHKSTLIFQSLVRPHHPHESSPTPSAPCAPRCFPSSLHSGNGCGRALAGVFTARARRNYAPQQKHALHVSVSSVVGSLAGRRRGRGRVPTRPLQLAALGGLKGGEGVAVRENILGGRRSLWGFGGG